MSHFRLSIAFQSNKTARDYELLAEQVDRYPFDVVSVYNDLLFQPALGVLIIMARKLQRAMIGPAALNPYTVHPVEIAGQIALLDSISNGRGYLGLVRGAWLRQIGVKTPRPVQAIREAILIVRHLLAHNEAAFDGQVFHLEHRTVLNYQPLRETVPIMIGTWGKRTATMAGEVADEVKVGGSANPDIVPYLQQAIQDGERLAGRKPGTVGICLGAVTVIDEDRQAARALARREVSLYLPVVAGLDPTLNDPEWLERVQIADAHKDYSAIAALISDEILDRFAFAGDGRDIISQVERLYAAGATRVEFGTPHGVNPFEGIRLLGEQVLPQFIR